MHDLLLARIKHMISTYKKDPVLSKFMTKLKNAGANLFRCVLDPAIPATNNAAERALREVVVHRKIRGCIRTEDTMTWMANLFTHIISEKMAIRPIRDIASYV